MPRKYVSPKRKEKTEKWTNDYIEKLNNDKKWLAGEEATLRRAKYLANNKWSRKQNRKEIETYIPLPNKWVKKLNEKRREKGVK
tara:strand:+ start:495 stop:746 length:252 start_codon:yes stop_codon:yes gene_type:complete